MSLAERQTELTAAQNELTNLETIQNCLEKAIKDIIVRMASSKA
jgi:hypothetical protein